MILSCKRNAEFTNAVQFDPNNVQGTLDSLECMKGSFQHEDGEIRITYFDQNGESHTVYASPGEYIVQAEKNRIEVLPELDFKERYSKVTEIDRMLTRLIDDGAPVKVHFCPEMYTERARVIKSHIGKNFISYDLEVTADWHDHHELKKTGETYTFRLYNVQDTYVSKL